MADVESQAPTEDKHAGGRPMAFATIDELEQAIRNYFDDCDPHIAKRQVENGTNDRGETIWTFREVMTDQKPYTMSGLARHLEIDRKTLLNYSKIEQFFPTILAARERVHEFAESQLYSRNASGAAFNLKNNFDWRDRSEVDHTTKDKPISLLAGIAPSTLEVEDEDSVDGGTAQADDGSHEDQQPS